MFTIMLDLLFKSLWGVEICWDVGMQFDLFLNRIWKLWFPFSWHILKPWTIVLKHAHLLIMVMNLKMKVRCFGLKHLLNSFFEHLSLEFIFVQEVIHIPYYMWRSFYLVAQTRKTISKCVISSQIDS